MTYCDVLTLSREAFEFVVNKFPAEGELIKVRRNNGHTETERMERDITTIDALKERDL